MDGLNSIYRGVVEDNNDPNKSGKVKVRVIGIHTSWNDEKESNLGISTENLPWAEPATPIFGGISKVGIYGVPCNGSHVFLFFENGNSQRPIYFATAVGIPGETPYNCIGFNDPDENYPKIPFEPDWNVGTKATKQDDKFVIQDKAGNKIEFCSEAGKEGIIIEHGKTCARIVFDSTGGIKNEVGRTTSKTHCGAIDLVCSGDSNEFVVGDKISSSKGLSITAFGNKKEGIMGSCDTSVSGIDNRKSKGLSWNVEGDSSIMTGGKASHVSDSDVLVKSNKGDIKLKALAMNVEITALLQVSSSSMMFSANADISASVKGKITTDIGGGVMTTVNSSAVTTVSSDGVTMIKGSIIMIG
jgi:hypothetical protein